MKPAFRYAFVILIASIPACDSKKAEADPQASQDESGESAESALTPLSLKAASLKTGMSRSDVIRRLGTPDWVIVPADTDKDWNCAPGITLNLAWRNGSHFPVVVDFSGNHTVSGWDEGRQEMSAADSNKYLPPNSFLATQPGRSQFAQP